MNVSFPPASLGAVIALVVLVLVIVLAVVNQLDPKIAALFALMAVSRLT